MLRERFLTLRRQLMKTTSLGLFAAMLAGSCALGVPDANADWTVTTYNQIVGNPDVTSMAIADSYFTGARPSRFVGTSTVTEVDLGQGGGGQFAINHPFPGLDNIPSASDTDDFTARIWGTLVVNTAATYDFFTDSDDGNRFRLDLNQNGAYEDATESIVPDGGLQGQGTPERSGAIALAAGNYNFEVSFFERGGGAGIDAGYRVDGLPTQYVLGNDAGGIGMLAPADVRTVGALKGGNGPDLTNFAIADALRTGPNEPGFPVTEFRNMFNISDSGGDGDFGNDEGAPGLGAPGASDDDDFLVVGLGYLVVPAGGITNAIFRSNTDDGGRLLIDTNQDNDLTDPTDVVILQDALQGDTNTDSSPISLASGIYLTEYSWFERGGGGQGEVSVSLAGGAAGTFYLLGDDFAARARTGLDVATVPVPEPATFALAGLAMLGWTGARRRK
jgi:hypothetical protein